MKESDGVLRVRARDFALVKKSGSRWVKTDKFDVSFLLRVVQQYKSHGNLSFLLDSKDERFLKGYLDENLNLKGERVNFLPDGEKLDGAFSLFSSHVTVHDEKTNEHWDVLYLSPSGNLVHLYSLKKKEVFKKKKYKKVREFKKALPRLERNLQRAIEKDEHLAIAMYTLLKSHMRVGNRKSYLEKGHKGLTTLEKKDVKVNKKRKVCFEFVGKDGVPQKIENVFGSDYVNKISQKLKVLKEDDFVFTNEDGDIFNDVHFEKGFFKYCKKRFYPHIVRSHYATLRVEVFLKKHKQKRPTKSEVKKLYDDIALRLGHKKFDKKTNEWKVHHTVTLSYYVEPSLVEKVRSLVV